MRAPKEAPVPNGQTILSDLSLQSKDENKDRETSGHIAALGGGQWPEVRNKFAKQ